MPSLYPFRVTLALVAKEPVPGRVKTRLCPPCTLEEAAAIARAALLDTLDTVAATVVERAVLVLDGQAGDWLPGRFEICPQRGDRLDQRLAAALEDLGGAVLLIGMDTPQLSPALLQDALAVLCAEGIDAVLGPTTDGGYWCIGFREPRPEALLGIPMRSSATFTAQQQRLSELGLRTTLLPVLTDVDTFALALEVAEQVPGSRFAHAVARVQSTQPRPGPKIG